MTTNTETLTPRVARVPQSAATYRLVRPLEPDEAARNTAEARESDFRANELSALPVASTLGAAASFGAAMFLAGHYGNLFLTSALLLQIALVIVSLYATRRVFALLVGRTRAGAYYAGGDFRRHVTGTDVLVATGLLTFLLPHLALAPTAQALAAGLGVVALLAAQRISVRALRRRLEADEAQEMERALLPAAA